MVAATVAAMSRRRSALLFVALSLSVLTSCGGGDSTGDAAGADSAASSTAVDATTPPTVADTTPPAPTTPPVGHIRGTAYTFNTPDPIAGATVAVEEDPSITAVTGADGSYELTVPIGMSVTPFIEAEGHHSIHLQTFTVDDDHEGSEIDGANFQTPTDGVYDGLRGLITGFVGKDPFKGGCVIVTTVSDQRVVGMSFAEFIEFHPHGKAGATASLDPANAQPIYFNEDVIPDLAQTTTSNDGGVLWSNVPPGDYTLRATLEGTAFAEVRVRCEQDWVVNANPVWGLHELP